MSSKKQPTGHVVELPSIGMGSGSDASSSKDNKNMLDNGDKKTSLSEGIRERFAPAYADIESVEPGEDVITHEANQDDILTHTIHVEDDPSTPALTFRTWFLGIALCYRFFMCATQSVVVY